VPVSYQININGKDEKLLNIIFHCRVEVIGSFI
jgi:hypothetical protein